MGWIRRGSAALLVAGGFGVAEVKPAEAQVTTTSTPTTTSTSTSAPPSIATTSTPTTAVTTTAVTTTVPPPSGTGLVVAGTCFDAATGTFFWTIENQTTAEIEVDLVLNGVPLGELIVPALTTETVGKSGPGVLQALVDDIVQAQSSSSDAPCVGPPPPTVSPSVVQGEDGDDGEDGEDGEEGEEGADGALPSTGGSEGALLGAGLACALAGLILLAARRRGAIAEDHRTPVRS